MLAFEPACVDEPMTRANHNRHPRRFLFSAACLSAALAVAPLAAQSPSFEVVSVKHVGNARNSPQSIRPFSRGGDRVTCLQTLFNVITRAYSIKNHWQLEGPDWLTAEAYDISAVVPPGTGEGDVLLMLRTMLADRLDLKLHHVQKEFPGYALVVAKNGSRLEEVPKPERWATKFSVPQSGTARFEAVPAVPLSQLAQTLESATGKPVLDETGMAGYYKIVAEWSLEPGDSNNTAGLLSALPKLGLKLEPRKAAFDVFVVDQIKKEPTAN
jgi:uncharacterized protein (TIGR03435 family)